MDNVGNGDGKEGNLNAFRGRVPLSVENAVLVPTGSKHTPPFYTRMKVDMPDLKDQQLFRFIFDLHVNLIILIGN